MKKILLTVGVALFAVTASAAGNKSAAFGAGLKPDPTVTLFGQKLSWPIPSLCVGKSAGVTPDFEATPSGLKFRLPYLSVDLPFPSLLLGSKDKKVEVKLGEINKSEQE